MTIFTPEDPAYTIADLGFDKSLVKSLFGLSSISPTPELANVITAGVAPKSLISGELLSSFRQEAGVLFAGKVGFDNVDAGYILGVDEADGVVKFYIGDSTNYLNWTGTSFIIAGSLIASSGTIGGFDIGLDYIRDTGNSFGLASTVTGAQDVRFWAGASFANRNTAPLRFYENGSAIMSDIVLTGLQAGSSIDGTYITSLAVSKLTTGTISSKQITLAITAGTGDVFIAAGKTDFTNTDTGFILGLDDSDSDLAKFYIGTSSIYMNWTGAAMTITGAVLNVSDQGINFYDGAYKRMSMFVESETVYMQVNNNSGTAIQTLYLHADVAYTFDFSSVDTGNETIGLSTAAYAVFGVTGTAVTVSTTDTLPNPLAAATTYYTRGLGSLTIALYSNLADANADNNRINFTNSGSGTHTLHEVIPSPTIYSTKASDLGTAGSPFIVGHINRIQFQASALAHAAFNIPAGVDPTSPNDGDVWYLSNKGLMFRDATETHYVAMSNGNTGGAGSGGAGNQYVEVEINGVAYKVLHDGTV